MATGRQIITKALQKARILTKHEAPDGDEIADGLSDLNAMVSSWANDTLMAFVRTSESFPIFAATASYTIGAGATFDTSRPLHIVSAYTRVGGTDYHIERIRDSAYDNDFSNKDAPGYPRELLYEAANPTATITLYPVPIASGTIHIRSEKPLAAFTLDTEIDLPPGWERALIFNLAIELAPDYGAKIGNDVATIAADSKRLLKTNSNRNRSWDTPPLTRGAVTNVLSGPV